MATPVSETIITDILTALEGVTVQNGYNNTLAWVGRYDRRENKGPGDKRPYAQVRYLGDSFSSPSESERHVTTRLEIKAVLDRDIHTEDATSNQENILGFDVSRALADIDIDETYDIGDIDPTPFTEIDEDETQDGVIVLLSCTYSVDRQAIGTITGPGG